MLPSTNKQFSIPKYESLLTDLSNTHAEIKEALEALSYKLQPLTIPTGVLGSCSSEETVTSNSALNVLILKRLVEARALHDLINDLTRSIDL